jgi:hypothetical protein
MSSVLCVLILRDKSHIVTMPSRISTFFPELER